MDPNWKYSLLREEIDNVNFHTALVNKKNASGFFTGLGAVMGFVGGSILGLGLLRKERERRLNYPY